MQTYAQIILSESNYAQWRQEQVQRSQAERDWLRARQYRLVPLGALLSTL